jgi:CDP-glycerol glycerophosphotransferase
MEIFEAGSPRNDVLVDGRGDEIRQELRIALGLENSDRLFLFAPTWRDYLTSNPWSSPLPDNLNPLKIIDNLPENVHILFRGHPAHRRSGAYQIPLHPRLQDVSDYPEVSHLMLASDAAILDYSSMRFDYSITGKPMIFFIPDHEKYFKANPPLFDYFTGLPGPACADSKSLESAIMSVVRSYESWEYYPAIQSFKHKFSPLDDGHATERTVNYLINRLGCE